jgi:hypothetical protein
MSSNAEDLVRALKQSELLHEIHSARLAAAVARIRRHPMHAARQRMDNMAESLEHVFRPNADALQLLLVAASQNHELAVELVQNVRRSIIAERFRLELA